MIYICIYSANIYYDTWLNFRQKYSNVVKCRKPVCYLEREKLRNWKKSKELVFYRTEKNLAKKKGLQVKVFGTFEQENG